MPDPKVLLVQALGFVLVLGVLWKFFFNAARDILAARQKDVETYYSSAEEDRKAAAELKAEYEKQIADIETEMRAKITQAAKEGQALREEIVAEARQKADEILARAEEQFEREKESAMTELREKVVDLTLAATAKLIQENMDEPKQRQLVSRAIDDLDKVSR